MNGVAANKSSDLKSLTQELLFVQISRYTICMEEPIPMERFCLS